MRYVPKYGTDGQATDDNTVQVHCSVDKATDTH